MCSLVAPAECSVALSNTDKYFHDHGTSYWTALLHRLSKIHSADLCDNVKDCIRAQWTATVPQGNPREKPGWAVCSDGSIWFWCLSSEAVGVAKSKNNTCVQAWVRATGTLFFNTLCFWQHSSVPHVAVLCFPPLRTAEPHTKPLPFICKFVVAM